MMNIAQAITSMIIRKNFLFVNPTRQSSVELLTEHKIKSKR